MIPEKNSHIIVVGNEKGGAGKTTTCMHLVAYLLNLGLDVATIDVDSRQKSLSRYIENRATTKNSKDFDVRLPKHFIAEESTANDINERNKLEEEGFVKLLEEAKKFADFVVIDTPGSNTNLSRVAHSYADTIVTPINDSFLDLDILAKIDAETHAITSLSHFSQFLWERKLEKAKRQAGELNWIVVRNRLSNIDANNKRNILAVLEKLSKRVGFKLAEGFSERVIFRELFLHGLTLLDINKNTFNINFSMSHIAAKQELRNFLKALNLEKINNALNKKELQTTE